MIRRSIILLAMLLTCCNGVRSITYQDEDVVLTKDHPVTVANRVAVAIELQSIVSHSVEVELIAIAKYKQRSLQVLTREYRFEPEQTIQDTLVFDQLIYDDQVDFFTFSIR